MGDLGFVGLDDDPDDPVIITGRKVARKRPLTDAQKEANKLIGRERAAKSTPSPTSRPGASWPRSA